MNINGAVQQGALSFNVGSRLTKAQTEKFTVEFEKALNEMIEHGCHMLEQGAVYTPSDYLVGENRISSNDVYVEFNKKNDASGTLIFMSLFDQGLEIYLNTLLPMIPSDVLINKNLLQNNRCSIYGKEFGSVANRVF